MDWEQKIREFEAERYAFELPDGSRVRLRPVKAIEVIPRLGIAPSAVGAFLAQGQGGDVPPEDLPQAAVLASRLEEAYFVFGVVEPKLRFTHDDDADGIAAEVFKDYVRTMYGEHTLKALEKKLHEISGEIAPEEVVQDRESFRSVAQSPALPREDVRDEPD